MADRERLGVWTQSVITESPQARMLTGSSSSSTGDRGCDFSVNHVVKGDDHAGGMSSGGCGIERDSSVGISSSLLCHGDTPVVARALS
jgi:hypothetical protein